MLRFSIEGVAPKLASLALRNAVCETVSGHAHIMVGSFSESSLLSWQAQHFVNLHVQISWQAQHFANLHAQISWQAHYKMHS